MRITNKGFKFKYSQSKDGVTKETFLDIVVPYLYVAVLPGNIDAATGIVQCRITLHLTQQDAIDDVNIIEDSIYVEGRTQHLPKQLNIPLFMPNPNYDSNDPNSPPVIPTPYNTQIASGFVHEIFQNLLNWSKETQKQLLVQQWVKDDDAPVLTANDVEITW